MFGVKLFRHCRFWVHLLVCLSIGFTALPKPAIAQEEPAPEGKILFQTDFEDETQDSNWNLGEGWRFERMADGNRVLVGTGHEWANLNFGYEWTDYSLRCHVKFSGAAAQLHINARTNFSNNVLLRYFLNLGPGIGTQIGLSKTLDNNSHPYLTGSYTGLALDDDKWHEIVMTVRGARIQASIDGQTFIDYTDNAPYLSGSIAFESIMMDNVPEGTLVQVDDITVTELEPVPFILDDGSLDKTNLINEVRRLMASGRGLIRANRQTDAIARFKQALALVQKYKDHEAFANDRTPTALQSAEFDALVGLGSATRESAQAGSATHQALAATREPNLVTSATELAELFDLPWAAVPLLAAGFEDPDTALENLDEEFSKLDLSKFIDEVGSEEETFNILRFLLTLIKGGSQYQEGEFSAAEQTLQEAQNYYQTPAVYYYLALVYEAQNKYEQARFAWANFIWNNYNQNNILSQWADEAQAVFEAYFEDLDQAEAYLEDAIALSETFPDEPQGLGDLYLELGYLYQQGTRSHPDSIHYPLGWSNMDILVFNAQEAFGLAGDNYQRVRNFWRFGEARFQQADMQSWLADTRTSFKDKTDTEWYLAAIDNFRQAIQQQPDQTYWRYRFGETAFTFIQRFDMGRLHKADEIEIDIDALLREIYTVADGIANNWHANYWRGMANACLARRNDDQSYAWSAINDLNVAVSTLESLIENEGGSRDYHRWRLLFVAHYLGRMYYMVDRPDQAAIYLQRARSIYDNYFLRGSWLRPEWSATKAEYENYWMLGDSLVATGRYTDAIDAYQSAGTPRRYSVYPKLMAGLSEAYQSLGLYAASLPALKERQSYYERKWEELIRKAESDGVTPDAALTVEYQAGIIDTLLRMTSPLLVLGRSEEALTRMQEAMELATELNDQTTLVNTHLRLGDIYLVLDRDDDALTNYQTAADLAQRAGLNQPRGRALLGIGRIQMGRGQLVEARQTLYLALTAAQYARDIAGQVKVLTAQGDLALLGDTPDTAAALRSYQQALQIAEQSSDIRLSVDTLINIGDLQTQNTEDLLTASLTYHRALARAESVNDHDAIARIGGRLGQLMMSTGQLEVADRHFSAALDLVEQTQRGFQSETLQSQFAANYAWIYTDYVSMLFQEGRTPEAFTVAERARARAFLDQLAAGPLDLREGASADLLEEEVRLRREIDATRQLLLKAQQVAPVDREYIQELRDHLFNKQNAYMLLFERLQAQNPQLATLTGVETASLAEIQAALDPDTTLLSFYTAPERTFVFLVTADDFTGRVLDVTEQQLKEAIDRFRADETQTAPLTELYTLLIDPIKHRLNTPHLTLVPHGVLHYLPFAALINQNGELLGEIFALNYLPSATSLLYLPDIPEQPGEMLALGDPEVEGLHPLPNAEDEVQAVVEIMGGQAVTGEQATEAMVWQRSDRAGILYLAAHGEFNKHVPLFSTLHLAPGQGEDGRLEAHEIYRLDLTSSTELVVLSACETGVGVLTGGDEFTGLNRAFLYAGAPRVIATLWQVDDAATRILMEAFFKARSSGQGNAEALQTAQQTVRNYQDEDGKMPYTAPYYWAAFVLVGRG